MDPKRLAPLPEAWADEAGRLHRIVLRYQYAPGVFDELLTEGLGFEHSRARQYGSRIGVRTILLLYRWALGRNIFGVQRHGFFDGKAEHCRWTPQVNR